MNKISRAGRIRLFFMHSLQYDLVQRNKSPPSTVEKGEITNNPFNNAVVSQHTRERAGFSTALSAVRFKNFDEMLSAYFDRLVLVDFHARWCGPCRLQQKELEIVRDDFGGIIKVFNVDMEKFPKLGSRFDVEGLPTLLLFKEGKEVYRRVGVVPAEELIREVKAYL